MLLWFFIKCNSFFRESDGIHIFSNGLWNVLDVKNIYEKHTKQIKKNVLCIINTKKKYITTIKNTSHWIRNNSEKSVHIIWRHEYEYTFKREHSKNKIVKHL